MADVPSVTVLSLAFGTATECMRVMGGMFAWSIELEESLAYCMLDAGEFIAHLYGGLDGEPQ